MNSKYDYDINKKLHKLPNKMHLQACIDGGNVYKNRKKYNRKVKHKNRFMSDLGYEQEVYMEYNKILVKDFMETKLWVTFKNREEYLRWANGIKCLNLLWCHGQRIEENDFSGDIKAVSIRRGYCEGGRLQFTQ